ncbi:MAG: hypothetical protein J0H62_00220 [Rhizobiales bacterium]|nr:hypothetical protein [Hyphomicrobiales bacterium]
MFQISTSLRKLGVVAVAAATIAGSIATTSVNAEARPGGGGGFRGGGGGGGWHGGGGFRGGGGWHGGGFRGGGWRGGGGWGWGPGIVGGLALGALAASPYYGYGGYGGYYGYGPGYYGGCWTERQRVIDRYGRVFIRPVRVCE